MCCVFSVCQSANGDCYQSVMFGLYLHCLVLLWIAGGLGKHTTRLVHSEERVHFIDRTFCRPRHAWFRLWEVQPQFGWISICRSRLRFVESHRHGLATISDDDVLGRDRSLGVGSERSRADGCGVREYSGGKTKVAGKQRWQERNKENKGGRNRICHSQLPSAPQGLRGIRLTSMTSMSTPLVSHVTDTAQAEVAFHLFYHPPQTSGGGTSSGGTGIVAYEGPTNGGTPGTAFGSWLQQTGSSFVGLATTLTQAGISRLSSETTAGLNNTGSSLQASSTANGQANGDTALWCEHKVECCVVCIPAEPFRRKPWNAGVANTMTLFM